MNWLLATAIQLRLDDELQQMGSIFNTDERKEKESILTSWK